MIEANERFEIAYSVVQGRWDTEPMPVVCAWRDLCARLAEPDRTRGELSFEAYHALDSHVPASKKRRDSEKDGLAWIPATFLSGGNRTNGQVAAMTAFVGDCDNGRITLELIKEKLDGLEFFAHSSYSHRREHPKLRIVVPFSRPIPPEMLQRVFTFFASLFDDNLDPVGRKPAQLYYLPSCPFDGPFEHHRGRGAIFDPYAACPAGSTPQVPSRATQPAALTAQTGLLASCKDGERHQVILPVLGRWVAHGLGRGELLERTREWNASNIDAWPDEKLVALVDGMLQTDARNHPERHGRAPWADVELPQGYRLTGAGTFVLHDDPDKPDTRISGPVWVSASTRNMAGGAWGRRIEWLDGEARHHRAAVPASRLHETGHSLAQALADDGLNIVPGRERQLLIYLAHFRTPRHLRSVDRLGWLQEPDGHSVFVLPDKTVAYGEQEDCVFQPEKHSPTALTINSRGSLEQWQREVAEQTAGNPSLLFCLCAAFAGPLLKAARLDTGGFHLYGRSSHGKTTAAQVAASVWGCGADPASDPETAYSQRWNTTQNGLEGLAAAHNDGLLILDEIGTCNAKSFGQVIYSLTGGLGKVAMNADRNLKQQRNWRLLLLSTGEISTRQKIEEEKEIARAGQLLRLLDVPIGDGVAQNSFGLAPAEFVRRLKTACSTQFGTAGPTFLERLIAAYPDFPTLTDYVAKHLDHFTKSLAVPRLEPEQQRALRRFALVQLAGTLAVDLDLLPCDRHEIAQAISSMRDAWLADLDILSEVARGVEAVRDFLLKHRARLAIVGKQDTAVNIPNLAGYMDTNERLYLLTPEALKEATRGFDAQAVCRELRRRKLLYQNETGRLASKHSIPGLAMRLRLYAITYDILEDGSAK